MNRWVLINKAADLTGYSKTAIDSKIDKGVWPEGVMWIKAPDNRRLINLAAFDAWVEGLPLAEIKQRSEAVGL